MTRRIEDEILLVTVFEIIIISIISLAFVLADLYSLEKEKNTNIKDKPAIIDKPADVECYGKLYLV